MEYDGHKVRLTNGYYDVYYPEHPRVRKSGSVMLQILVAEKILGRYLRDDEVVHHIDFNRLNNDVSNLMIFATLSDHACYHKMLESLDGDYVLYRIDGVYHCERFDVFVGRYPPRHIDANNKKRLMKTCPQCGELMSYTAKLCYKCSKLKSRKVNRPNRTILKSEIRKMPILQVANKYGVSDNAIRKWCKSYNLPYLSKEIKKYSAIEWKKI